MTPNIMLKLVQGNNIQIVHIFINMKFDDWLECKIELERFIEERTIGCNVEVQKSET